MREKILQKLNIIGLIGICIVGGLLYFIIKNANDDRDNKEQARISDICLNELPTMVENRYLDAYLEAEIKKEEDILSIKKGDLQRISVETFDCIQLSMWDDSVCGEEWYKTYLGDNLINADYLIRSVSELCEYLSTAFNTKNAVKSVYMCIEPNELASEYYNSICFDSEPKSFEEYLSDELFSIFSEHADTEFVFILPILSVEKYATISEEERSEMFSTWYTFAMYLRWNTNTRVVFAGAEEWLVTRPDFFDESGKLTEEYQKTIFLYEYAFADYNVTPPEIEEKVKLIEKYIRQYNNGDYDWSNASDKKVVFIGDGIFYKGSIEGVDIPSYFDAFSRTKSLTIDAIGATVAPYYDVNLLNIVKDKIDGDILEFVGEESTGGNVTFVINAGIFDYLVGTPAKTSKKTKTTKTTKSFEESYTELVSILKVAYPESRIITLTPHMVASGEYGTKKMAKTGGKLSEYVDIIKKISDKEDISCVDMYKSSGIDKSNAGKLLTDDVYLRKEKYMTYVKQIYAEIMREE